MRLVLLAVCALPMAFAATSPGGASAKPWIDPAKLVYEKEHGVLKSVLAQLGIDPRSQTLVFSKTSRQSDFIGPKTPRAIYFNADTYVGWIPGAPLIEIARLDPRRGVAFATIRNAPQPMLEDRPRDCALCHGDEPGRLFARSVPTTPAGYPEVFAQEFDATPSLPLERRWGGWYVTGTLGGQRHLGNRGKHTDKVTDLRPFFDTKPYLTPHSDVVALMVMESQMEIGNAIARAVYSPEAVEPLVEALVGVGEARLTAPITGTGGFAVYYEATAPKDTKGRSLSELDLKTRLLRYGCSPMIYSRTFAALSPATRSSVLSRLREVLSGKDRSETFDHLGAGERTATLEILESTLPDFPKA